MYRHYWISGRVQGVCFRFSTRERAACLGITGWVRNLRDGRVEVLAGGDEEALLRFENWLRQGPPGAVVTEVRSDIAPGAALEGFEIR